ncbi:MAG: hypothetical protein GF401_07550 [Chitinivibrionales bacterium]|nr:hypothetical protein [Chitinivibrionales bacterium]
MAGKKNSTRFGTVALLHFFFFGSVTEFPALSLNGPFAYITATKPGVYVFKMVPAEKKADCKGIVYRVGRNGALEEIWQTKGVFDC